MYYNIRINIPNYNWVKNKLNALTKVIQKMYRVDIVVITL